MKLIIFVYLNIFAIIVSLLFNIHNNPYRKNLNIMISEVKVSKLGKMAESRRGIKV